MPNQKSDINLFASWNINVVILFTIPLILLGCIHIYYGDIIGAMMAQQNLSATSIFELKTQLFIFQNDTLTPPPYKSFPELIRIIGINSVKAIYLLLLLWIIGFSISSYKKLSHRSGSKSLMLFEILLMVIIFTYTIKPGLSLPFTILGYIVLSVLIIILVLYWIEGIKNRR